MIHKIHIRTILALFMLILYHVHFGQKIEKTNGSAQVKLEDDMTLKETRLQAEHLAMIDAIEKVFGTYVEQQTDMFIEDGKTAYNIIGTTKVKGDWIETTSIDFKEHMELETGKYGKQNVKYITCNIRGKVRESLPKADIEFVVLNCPDKSCRTTDFFDGEQLYLYFKSPVDGYVSVYVDEGDFTYRLLPYVIMGENYQSGVFVKADTEYLFFSDQSNPFQEAAVDEIEMFTNKNIEYNTIYVVFAEDKFVKPRLSQKQEVDGRILPKSLMSDDFQQWLTGNRGVLTSFQDRKIKISIRPN